METLRQAQVTEAFHLAFLGVLQARVSPSRYVLKGGTNLRYFFDSVRYSEDIDLDLDGIETWQLNQKVNALLDSPAINMILQHSGLSIVEINNAKDTTTTQRWKVGIYTPGHEDPIRTKIEFSNRNGETRYQLDPVPSRLVEPYALRSPTIKHYLGDAATEQKVETLADRTETQARDVFDLDLLLRRFPLSNRRLDSDVLKNAADRALELPYGAFRDQVLPFLDPEVADIYATEAAWEQMQTFVAEKLEEAR